MVTILQKIEGIVGASRNEVIKSDKETKLRDNYACTDWDKCRQVSDNF